MNSIFTAALGIVILTLGCKDNQAQFAPPSESKLRSLYQDPVTIDDAPRLRGESSQKRDIQFLMYDAGKVLSGTIQTDPNGEDIPRMVDGEKECLLESGTKVNVFGQFNNEGKDYFVIQVEEPCNPEYPDYVEGNIAASVVQVEDVDLDALQVDDVADIDLIFNHFDENGLNQDGSQSGSFDPNDPNNGLNNDGEGFNNYVGCTSAGQTIINDPDSSRVRDGVKRRLDRAHRRNKDCIGATNVCGLNGENFRLMGRMPDRRRNAHKQVALAIKGSAAQWTIDTSSSRGTFPTHTAQVDASDETIVSFRDFVPRNNWKGGTVISMKVQGLDDAGQPIGDQCVHRLSLASPLVLDFANKSWIETTHPALAQVKFDLKADGIKEHTGWIMPSSAFLALDLNINGIIDDGSELFGESTLLPNGKKAENGYLALKQYDKNKDGFIDQHDPIFDKLLLWFDHNSDGMSQPGELFSLKEKEVTKIAVGYEDVPFAKQLTDGFDSGNRALFTSRFFGPQQCGTKGCRSYDIFFQTVESFVIK